jgi:hypothetical protein
MTWNPHQDLTAATRRTENLLLLIATEMTKRFKRSRLENQPENQAPSAQVV